MLMFHDTLWNNELYASMRYPLFGFWKRIQALEVDYFTNNIPKKPSKVPKITSKP